MVFLWKVIGILSIILVFFGSIYNLFAAEEYSKKNLNYIPAILRYIAYGIVYYYFFTCNVC